MSKFFRGRKVLAELSPAEDFSDIPLPSLSNRRQLVIFALLTVLLTGLSVWGMRVWFKTTSTLTFAVPNDNGVEARFADKLAMLISNSGSSLRIKIAKADNAEKVGTLFDRRQADLVLLRSDTKIPQRARSIAVVEHDLVMLLSPKGKPIGSLAALKGKKIAVLGAGEHDAVLTSRILDAYEIASARTSVTRLPADSAIDRLLAPGQYGAVIAVVHQSRLSTDKTFERLLKGPGFTLNEIGETKAINRKIPGTFADSIDKGLLSSSPLTPDDDTDTIGLQWLLLAQPTLSEIKGTDLARIILENRTQLALNDGFAAAIEPADTDKDAFVAAHRGAAQYIDDDTKTFFERYSDLIYISMAAASIFGSLFFGLYASVTRVAPEKAGALASQLLDIGEGIEDAKTLDELEGFQDRLEDLLRQVVAGLRDGTISSDGLDTFRLGYDFVRDSLDLRRDGLSRKTAHEEPSIAPARAAS